MKIYVAKTHSWLQVFWSDTKSIPIIGKYSPKRCQKRQWLWHRLLSSFCATILTIHSKKLNWLCFAIRIFSRLFIDCHTFTWSNHCSRNCIFMPPNINEIVSLLPSYNGNSFVATIVQYSRYIPWLDHTDVGRSWVLIPIWYSAKKLMIRWTCGKHIDPKNTCTKWKKQCDIRDSLDDIWRKTKAMYFIQYEISIARIHGERKKRIMNAKSITKHPTK